MSIPFHLIGVAIYARKSQMNPHYGGLVSLRKRDFSVEILQKGLTKKYLNNSLRELLNWKQAVL